MRTAPCGSRCGVASEQCEGGVWTRVSECLAEGECAAGEVERDTAMCRDAARICQMDCRWSAWTETTPPGECEAGTGVQMLGKEPGD